MKKFYNLGAWSNRKEFTSKGISSEKESTLKGKNLLSLGADSFLLTRPLLDHFFYF